MFVYVRFIIYFVRVDFLPLTCRERVFSKGKSFEMCLLVTEFDRPEVTRIGVLMAERTLKFNY